MGPHSGCVLSPVSESRLGAPGESITKTGNSSQIFTTKSTGGGGRGWPALLSSRGEERENRTPRGGVDSISKCNGFGNCRPVLPDLLIVQQDGEIICKDARRALECGVPVLDWEGDRAGCREWAEVNCTKREHERFWIYLKSCRLYVKSCVNCKVLCKAG